VAKKQHKTIEEKRWLDAVSQLGCVVCRNTGRGATPAEIHHIRAGQGMSQRASHLETIPLCVTHHRSGGNGVAVHAGTRRFEDNFGTERELLDQTKRDVEELRRMTIGGAA